MEKKKKNSKSVIILTGQYCYLSIRLYCRVLSEEEEEEASSHVSRSRYWRIRRCRSRPTTPLRREHNPQEETSASGCPYFHRNYVSILYSLVSLSHLLLWSVFFFTQEDDAPIVEDDVDDKDEEEDDDDEDDDKEDDAQGPLLLISFLTTFSVVHVEPLFLFVVFFIFAVVILYIV